MFGLVQEFHGSLTLPISHYKYNEWWGKVEIGGWALKWSPPLVFESGYGGKVGLALLHFSHQDWMTLDWFNNFTASQPFWCLIISIMNGFARLRFEFVVYNHHHTPDFDDSRAVTISAQKILPFTPRWSMFGLVQEFHGSLTLPISHYKYNEWWGKVEIGGWALKWSPPLVFESGYGGKVGLALLHFSHQDWMTLDWFNNFTAS